MAENDDTPWRNGVTLIKDLGEYAKFFALILAIVGFFAVYFPGARRAFEVHLVGVDNYYNLGLLVGPPSFAGFRPRSLASPVWDGGLQSVDDFFALNNQIVFTEKGDLVGREAPSPHAPLGSLYGKGTCLYIKDVSFIPYRREPRPGGKELLIPVHPVAEEIWSQPLSSIKKAAKAKKVTPYLLFASSLPKDIAVASSQCGSEVSPTQPRLCPRISVWIKARRVTC